MFASAGLAAHWLMPETSGRRRLGLLRTSTALPLALLLLAATATTGAAQVIVGADGQNGTGSAGGLGSSPGLNDGGLGSDGQGSAGPVGGGAGGVNARNGGNGGFGGGNGGGGLGGAGGGGGGGIESQGRGGGGGSRTNGGGGGGGGAATTVSSDTLFGAATITGGNGGIGAAGLAGGGGGGAGIVLSGTAVLTTAATIQGGNGGESAFGGSSGGGGGGGGIVITGTGTVINTGIVSGGNGGRSSYQDRYFNAGQGGIGIAAGGGATIINAGTIAGGFRVDSAGGRNDAIRFSGNDNRLELRAGSVIQGNVVGGGSDTLAIGGATDSSFDVSSVGAAAQYRGFGILDKAGTSTWTLTGTTTAVTAWTLSQGKLSITSDANLGATGGALTFNGGTLLNAGSAISSSRSIVLGAGGGTIETGAGASVTSSGGVSGAGALTKTGAGLLTLRGANTSLGGITLAGGSLVGDTTSLNGNIDVGNGTALQFDQANGGSYAGQLSGSGDLTKTGAGAVTLTGDSAAFSGPTQVMAGTLAVDGKLGGSVDVAMGATLSGTGTLTGDVTVGNGATLAAGASPGTLTVGALTLNAGSTSIFELNAPGIVGGAGNDLVKVTNDLSLGGTLDARVASAGYYRLYNYGGSLSGDFDNVDINGTGGFTPVTGELRMSVQNQVNLAVLGTGQTMRFWDGTDITGNGIVDGGAGTWSATNTNWTGEPGQADINDNWRGSVGVFAGAAGGAVTVVGTHDFDTLQFSTTGYELNGGALAIAPASGSQGTLNIDTGVEATIGSVIQDGTGTGLVKAGGGTLVLTGTNSYTGGTTITGGTLQLGNGGVTGTVVGNVSNNGVLVVNRSGTADVAGVMSGTGSVRQIGGGVTRLTADNSYVGGTFIDAGELRIGGGGTTGAIVGNVANNGALSFDRSDLVTFGGVVSGTGSLEQLGSGTLVLTGANSYAGGTVVSSGTLRIGAGGTTGSIAGDVVNLGRLAFDRSDNITFSGVISGNGALDLIGSGRTELTGNSAAFAGATTVSAGTLAVNGTLGGALSVAGGATLLGSGTVGTTVVNGTLSPGNAIGTLTVDGDLTFMAGATYAVQIAPATADRVNVSGTATLGGANVAASFALGANVAKQYTIVHSDTGVSGTFGSIANTNLPATFASSLSYDATNAYLDLELDFSQPPGSGLTSNQRSVANALADHFDRTGSIPIAFGGLTAAGLAQASGEVATGTRQATFEAMNLFVGLLTDPFIGQRGVVAPGGGAPLAYGEVRPTPAQTGIDAALAAPNKAAPLQPSRFDQRWWAAGFGGARTTDGNVDTGSNTATSKAYGMAVGADYGLSPDTLIGFAVAGGGTSFDIAGGQGSGNSDMFQAGAFVRHQMGSGYVTGALAYGWQDVTTERLGSDALSLRANFATSTVSGRIEAGYRHAMPALGVTPYVAGQVTGIFMPGYAEQGTSIFGLSYAARDVTATRTELGVRLDRTFTHDDMALTLRGRAAWAHDFNPGNAVAASFQALPGAGFVVNGAVQSDNAALVSASAEFAWRNGLSLAGTFEGEFSDVSTSYAGKGVLRYRW
ncbi:autotransporter domain-containing protein [Aminobacter anthyllidis]|uniref:Autotransporter domain-containing protein n=1 Tax=Aminobacter anthyllidis TaxID=1035067 RepID=A0A9X1A616_9HYPH|nr:autotransporter domain-containing protein [Aminobacter anthyllidis]MBT1153973.1 autotransporter domain-containing protein [Aminobacter anthyllidis]